MLVIYTSQEHQNNVCQSTLKLTQETQKYV